MVQKKITILFLLLLVTVSLSGCINKEGKYEECIEACCKSHGCKDGYFKKDEEGKYFFEECDNDNTYCREYEQDCKNICVKKYK